MVPSGACSGPATGSLRRRRPQRHVTICYALLKTTADRPEDILGMRVKIGEEGCICRIEGSAIGLMPYYMTASDSSRSRTYFECSA